MVSELHHVCYYLDRANHVSFPQSRSLLDAASCWESALLFHPRKLQILNPCMRAGYCSSLYPKCKNRRISKGNQKQVMYDLEAIQVMYLEAIYDFPLGQETQLLRCVEILRDIFSGHSLVDASMKQPAV